MQKLTSIMRFECVICRSCRYLSFTIGLDGSFHSHRYVIVVSWLLCYGINSGAMCIFQCKFDEKLAEDLTQFYSRTIMRNTTASFRPIRFGIGPLLRKRPKGYE